MGLSELASHYNNPHTNRYVIKHKVVGKYSTISVYPLVVYNFQGNPTAAYLKDCVVKNSGAKDGDAFSVDDGLVASVERPDHLLLTVHNDGDGFFLHTDSNTMPPGKQKAERL